MIFLPTPLPNAYILEPNRFEDQRGFYAPTWSQKLFADKGLNPNLAECNLSFNHKAGTLRGMHFQIAPHAQTKLVRCTMGAIWDAIIDLRPDSPTFKQWTSAELTAQNRRQLYIPEGFAHGFITLEDNTEVFYQMGSPYVPAAARGVRWNDPAFNIRWPRDVAVIIERDNTYPDLTES